MLIYSLQDPLFPLRSCRQVELLQHPSLHILLTWKEEMQPSEKPEAIPMLQVISMRP